MICSMVGWLIPGVAVKEALSSLSPGGRGGGWCLALDGQSNTHAATDTEGGQTFVGITLDHFMDQSHQNPAAGGTDGVAQGNSATVHVHLGGIPAQIPVNGNSLGREGFVGFNQIQIIYRPA